MMRRIQSRIDVHSESYQRFRAKNLDRLQEFHQRQNDTRFERPQRDLDRLAHHGKAFVRDRIESLLDPGTPFLEFSSLAANSEYGGDSKGASVVTGIGIVSGHEVIIRADDPSIKGGAWY
ncbi:MAG: carboxyl transferase domain-containing protein, partial [Myxococcota bacterium]